MSFALFLIGGGLLLILIAVLFAIIPVLSYVPIPVLGDVLDFPIGVIVGMIGIVLITLGLVLGGVTSFLSEFWWFIPVAFVIWIGVIFVLSFAKKKLKRR